MRPDDYAKVETTTSVYVLEWGGKAKIGIARDPEKRLRQLQLANPGQVTLVGQRAFSSRLSALLVERSLHKRFQSKRMLGEWFDLAPQAALTALVRAKDPEKHHPHWNPGMPHEIASEGILARWKWHRDNDLCFPA